MRARIGQATIDVGHLVRRAIGLVLAIALLAMTALAGLAWRLSEGPLDITTLARLVASHAAPEPEPGDAKLHIQIGAAALAWEGWRGGLDRPIDIRLDNVAAYGTDGTTLAVIPSARVSVSLAWLLLGRLVPRAVEIDGARLHAVRAVDGRISTVLGRVSAEVPTRDLGPDPFGVLLRELARPAQGDASAGTGMGGRWSQLRRVRIRDAGLMLADRELGVVWLAPQATLDLRRGPDGGVAGLAEITLAVGDQSTQVSATAQLAGGATTTVHARFTKLSPAALAHLSPDLAMLEAVDAPIEGGLDLTLDPVFDISHARFDLRMGAGTLRVAQGSVPVANGTLAIDADRHGLTLSAAQVALAAPNSGAGPVLRAQGSLTKAASGLVGRIALDVDQVAFAALPQYWPRGVAPGARDWITANITAGTARAAHVELGLSLGPGGQSVQVTSAGGQVSGDDVTVNWLRPVPPLEHGQATMSIVSPDELLITTAGGHQVGGALRVNQGTMRITGLSVKDQVGALDLSLGGPVADVWALLHQPRLQLLSRHPVDVGEPTGQLTGRLTLTLPLDSKVTIDQIAIHAQGQLTDLRLRAAGRSLDQGTLDFDVTGDGLKINGPARLAAIPTQLGLLMDFRTGPPQQVQMRLTAGGEATIAQLEAAGLDSAGLLSGSATIAATLEERRDGSGQVSLHADLAHTAIGLSATGWHHDAGGTASGDIHILLDHDRIVGIDHLVVEGDGISVLGRADYAEASPATLRLEHLVLGETRAAGSIRFTRPGVQVALSGPSLDLSGRFAVHRPRPAKAPAPASASDEKGPPWSVDLRFDQVLMAGRRRLAAVSVQAEDDGQVLRHAHLAGRTGADERFSLAITPDAGGRRLAAEAADAGALLAAADLTQAMQGGRLSLSGQFDDARADHRLSGTAEISDFRLRGEPAAAKLLQAMTLYGLVEALAGPGLGVTRMIVPFHYGSDVISLADGRAYSASLGATVKGQVDFASETMDLQGTIVPAYFFNTLLGGLPVVGRLFSPEKGGGVFAATYTLHGPLDDPSVGVNPLAALTPGFLRGLFGVFDKK